MKQTGLAHWESLLLTDLLKNLKLPLSAKKRFLLDKILQFKVSQKRLD